MFTVYNICLLNLCFFLLYVTHHVFLQRFKYFIFLAAKGLYKLCCWMLHCKPVTKSLCLLHDKIDGAKSWILDAKPVTKAMHLLHDMVDRALSYFIEMIYEVLEYK